MMRHLATMACLMLITWGGIQRAGSSEDTARAETRTRITELLVTFSSVDSANLVLMDPRQRLCSDSRNELPECQREWRAFGGDELTKDARADSAEAATERSRWEHSGDQLIIQVEDPAPGVYTVQLTAARRTLMSLQLQAWTKNKMCGDWSLASDSLNAGFSVRQFLLRELGEDSCAVEFVEKR